MGGARNADPEASLEGKLHKNLKSHINLKITIKLTCLVSFYHIFVVCEINVYLSYFFIHVIFLRW